MYRIGIDLGGTNIAAGLVNEKYEIVRKDSVPTNATERTSEEITSAIADLCRTLVAGAGLTLDDVDAIGIASPGIADHDHGAITKLCP